MSLYMASKKDIEPKKLIKILIEGDDIVIRVSLYDMKFIVENDPEYNYKIHNLKRFGKEMVFELENSKSHRNNEGMTAVEELFQEAYESVYEQGEDSVMTGRDLFP